MTLITGAGLLVFANPLWAQGVGVLALIACALTVFLLSATQPGPERSTPSRR